VALHAGRGFQFLSGKKEFPSNERLLFQTTHEDKSREKGTPESVKSIQVMKPVASVIAMPRPQSHTGNDQARGLVPKGSIRKGRWSP